MGFFLKIVTFNVCITFKHMIYLKYITVYGGTSMEQNMDKEIERNEIETKLFIPEQFDAIVSDIQKDILREELDDFLSIKENDVNIATVYAYDDKDKIEVKVYFRNGLNRKINFEYVPLIMVNEKGEAVGHKVFDLREMGDIPPCSATPWKLYFEKSSVDMEKFSPQDCKVVFNTQIKAVNYAKLDYEDFPQTLEDFRFNLEKFLEDLPKIERGQISISKFNIGIEEKGSIIITLVFRNSSDKMVKIDELPVTILDENDNIVASGKFKLDNFTISPMKAKICNMALQAISDIEETASVDKWRIIFE